MAVVAASGLVLLVLTFRAGHDEALEASSYGAEGTEVAIGVDKEHDGV